jgi:hypothetical protein
MLSESMMSRQDSVGLFVKNQEEIGVYKILGRIKSYIHVLTLLQQNRLPEVLAHQRLRLMPKKFDSSRYRIYLNQSLKECQVLFSKMTMCFGFICKSLNIFP